MTLAIDDAFRQNHPNVVSVIEKSSAGSLWQIVRAAPVVADAQPKAKAKSKAKALFEAKAQSKAKAKAKAQSKAKASSGGSATPQPEVVRLASCHDVRALLQRVRRVHRSGGVASEYFARAG